MNHRLICRLVEDTLWPHVSLVTEEARGEDKAWATVIETATQ